MKTVMSLVMAILLACLGGVAAADGAQRPDAVRLAQQVAAENGWTMPQAGNTYYYLFDLVSNAQKTGFGTSFVLTNYSEDTRIHIQGFVVPKGANPNQKQPVDIYLNPFEVQYVSLSKYLGDENGWAYMWSVGHDFGAGALLFNTPPTGGFSMTWIKPWYWVQ